MDIINYFREYQIAQYVPLLERMWDKMKHFPSQTSKKNTITS